MNEDFQGRDMIFVSHASEPIDTEFALWLTARLTVLGYDVWCDVEGLLGGEHVDTEIQQAIEDSAKVLYVLSDHSNISGPTRYPANELAYARQLARHEEVADFIVPLQVVPLSARTVISLQGLNVNRDFLDEGWARGLQRLVRKLERDGVPRPLSNGAAVTQEAWQARYGGASSIQQRTEILRSNWFPVQAFPKSIHIHSITGDLPDVATLPYPAVPFGSGLISFATLLDLELGGGSPGQLPLPWEVLKAQESNRTQTVVFDRFIRGERPSPIDERQARDAVVRLIRGAWDRKLATMNLPTHSLSGFGGDRTIHWFPEGFAEKNRAYYRDLKGERRYRQLTGKDGPRRWHLGVGMYVRTNPVLALEIRPHVLFSDDGSTLWDDAKKAHTRSRKLRRSWWNPKWRDMIHASMGWAAEERSSLELELDSARPLSVSTCSISFESPVTYAPPRRTGLSIRTLLGNRRNASQPDSYPELEDNLQPGGAHEQLTPNK